MRACAVIALALLCAQAAVAETIERTEPADPRGEVQIVNVSGDVQVQGWDSAKIQVEADLGDGVEKLDFHRDGDRTVIEVVLPSGRTHSGSTDLRVKIPRESSLNINTVSAEQTIQEVRGAQRLQSVSGMISTEVYGAELEAQSVSGDIIAKGSGGAAQARVTTVSGDVRLHGVGRELDLNTVSGDMEVHLDEISRARIKTTNGDLNLVSKLANDGRIDAEAINGDLTFMFRGKLDAEFDIETFNGDIENCFGQTPRRTREYGPGNELNFKLGQGNARVRIKTLNGTVEVCKQ
jgi:DUF4097 and DUF4098 domain-containing protein YvlB